MDKKTQKLKALVDRYLHRSKDELLKTLGKPNLKYNESSWVYNRYHFLFFKDVILFIFEEGEVVDIMLSEYIFWIEVRNVFYYENEDPEYRIMNLLTNSFY